MPQLLEGVVIRAQSRRFTVQVGEEQIESLVLKKLRYESPEWVDPVAVGDRVRVARTGDGGVVEEVLPRRNALARIASGRAGKRQLFAANVDRAVVVLAAAEPKWKTTTIDRYIVLASLHDIPAVVCINKIDLDPSVKDAPELLVYPKLGYGVVFVSAALGTGMDRLLQEIGGKTCVFVGPSGAGKSSLLNRLVPGAELRTGAISGQTGKGKHTTTWVTMLPMEAGGSVIDSPGIRVLDLSGIEAHELARHFPEFREPAQSCRFRDCSHTSEPDCEVKRWLESGKIEAHRHESYVRIYESLEAGRG